MDKEGVIVWIVVLMALCTIIWKTSNDYTIRTLKFIENGYTRTTLVGSDYTTWVRGGE